jgi:mono/diheme cytochrome c family protein
MLVGARAVSGTCYEPLVRPRLLPLLTFFCLATSCSRAPDDTREWRPSDHDHTTNPGSDQVAGGPDAGTAPELAAHGLTEVTIVAWQQNCVRCHGRLGRGDGPQGAMLRATDFTNQAWQASAKDDQLAKVIREGRGAMPPFALPDSTITSLVQLIRLLGTASAAPAASGSAAAPASARPLTSGTAAALPAGHPPLPAGHPPVPAASASALPPGHTSLPPDHSPLAPPPPARPSAAKAPAAPAHSGPARSE